MMGAIRLQSLVGLLDETSNPWRCHFPVAVLLALNAGGLSTFNAATTISGATVCQSNAQVAELTIMGSMSTRSVVSGISLGSSLSLQSFARRSGWTECCCFCYLL